MPNERLSAAQPSSLALRSLRGLAKAHSDQQISRHDYIHKRRDLIDDIVSGAAEIVAYVPEIVRPPPEPGEATIDGEETLELSFEDIQVAKSARSSRPWFKLAVVAALLAALAGASWFIVMRSPVKSVGNNSLVHERGIIAVAAAKQFNNYTTAYDDSCAPCNALKFLLLQS